MEVFMVLAKTDKGFFVIRSNTRINAANAEDAFYLFAVQELKVPNVYPTFPFIKPTIIGDFFYRTAAPSDLAIVRDFCDYWLSGKGYSAGVPGAGHDFFIPTERLKDYIIKYTTLLCFLQSKIVGWAVRQRDGSLIHLLVAANVRGRGIGAQLLELLDPLQVRSKSDQSTGDPIDFYVKHGYKKTSSEKIGKHHNIDVLAKDVKV